MEIERRDGKILCLECGKLFKPSSINKRICSDECRVKRKAKHIKEYGRKWRWENLEYNRNWRQENAKHIKEYDRRWRQENAKHIKEYGRKWGREYNSKFPERVKAKSLAQKLPNGVCSIKGCAKIGEKHHPDYSKPLEVVYLCRSHHIEEHIRLARL